MNSSGSVSFVKICVVTLMLVSYTNTFALAAPKGGHVVSGTATFQQDGNLTVITAGNRTVINYQGFNVGTNETVRFVQPGAHATVLNRVLSVDPTNIFGQIQSNGIVYIVNPYGVFFQNGAVLNVGGLYAAAGRISNEDFTAGRIHFTDLKGDVRNDGVLAADNRIALLGANVVNTGTMTSAKGMAMMVSGEDVYVGPRDGNIFVQANGKAVPTGPAGSVTNGGAVSAPRVVLGAGDMYSTAIVNTGLLQGRSIAVNAGRNGSASVGGRLDASSAAGGPGGSIQVLGGSVALRGATLDASGATGGGSVRVGGDFHGAGDLAHAATTTVDAATTIRADATGATGEGGTVVLWSDASTDYAGQISARGPDGGGAVEVSSHDNLSFNGGADLRPTTATGKLGSLLLDPTNITITNTGTPNVVPTAGGTVGFNDVPATNPPSATISAATLTTVLTTGSVTLQATNDINVNNNVTGAVGALTLNAGHSIAFAANVVLTLATGKFTATVRDPGGNAGADGAFTMDATSSINAVGGISITGVGTTAAPGGAIQVTSLSTVPALPSTAARSAITLDSGKGAYNVTAGTLDTSANNAAKGGDITISSAGAVAVNTAVKSSSSGGAGGAFTVGASAGGTAPTSLSLVVPNTAGSTATNGGNISLTSLGTITFGAAPTFTGNTSLTGTKSAPVAINGGGYDLTLNLSAQQYKLSNITNVRSFTTGGLGTLADANFTTPGNQTYNSPLTLSTDVTLTSSGGAIQFAGIVNDTSSHALAVSAATGGVTFTQSVGTTALPLTSLGVTGNATFSGGPLLVTTSGNQTYANNVAANATLTTLTSQTGVVTAPTATGTGALTVNGTGATFGAITLSGGLTFGLNMGVANLTGPISALSLTRNGLGVTNFSGGTVTTASGGQIYGGALILGADTTLTDSGSGALTFQGAIASNVTPGAPPINNVWTLRLLTNGLTTFGGLVGGGGHQLGSLTVGGPGFLNGSTVFNAAVPAGSVSVATLNTGSAADTGVQTYNNAVLLGQDTVLQSTVASSPAGLLGGNVTFASTVNTSGATARALTVNTTGSEFFQGLVGNTGPLFGLTTDQPGFVGGQAQFLMTVPTTAPARAGVTTLGGGVVTGDQAVFGVLNSSSSKVPALISGVSGLNAPTVTTTGPQNYASVILTRSAVFQGPSLTTASITGTPAAGDPVPNLTLDLSGQLVTVNGGGAAGPTIGSISGINGFASVGDGGTALSGNISFPGYQYYYGNPANLPANGVVLLGTTTLTSTGNANVGFGGILNGPFQLSINTGGDTYFDGLVGNATALTGLAETNAGGTTHFDMTLTGQPTNTAGVNVNGNVAVSNKVDFSAPGSASNFLPVVQTAGTQSYTGAATLGQDAVLTGTGLGSNLTFLSTVDGAHNLTLNSQGNEYFNQSVGGIAPLFSLRTDDDTRYQGGSVNFGSTAIPAVTVTVTTSNNFSAPGSVSQTYNDNVVLQTDTTLRSTSVATAGGAILFKGTVDGDGSSARGLTLNTPDTVTFNGTVGVNAVLRSLGITATRGTIFNNPAGLSGLANGQADVNVSSGGVTILGPTTFNLADSTLTNGLHPTVASTGAQSYTGPITLGGPTSLYTTGGDISLTGTVNGAFGLSVAASGNELFGGVIGNTTPLTSLLTDAFGVSGGQARFAFDAAGQPAGVRVGAGGVQLNDGVVFNVANTTLARPTVLVFGGGTQNYLLAATVSADTFLVGDSSATAPTGGVYTGGGNVTFSSTVTGSAAVPSLTIRTGTGATTFGSTVNVRQLDLTGAKVTITGAVSGLNLLSIRSNDGTNGTIPLNGTLGGGITTSNGQFYGSAVTLGANTTLTDTNNGNIVFNSTLDGAYQLTINTGGATTFNGLVGGNVALLSVTTDDQGTGVTNINGGGVRTGYLAGSPPFGQFYGDRVVLGKDTTLNADFAGPGVISFNKSVDSAAVNTPFALTATGYNVTFGGPVGAGAPLKSLDVSGANQTFLNGGGVTTTLSQKYNSALGTVVGTVTSLKAGTDLSFLTVLDGVATPATDTSLTLTAPGQLLFKQAVGGTNALTSLTVNGGTLALNGGLVRTALGQTYNGAVNLGAVTNLTSLNLGNVTVNATLDGAFDLAVNTGSLTEFAGKVGGTTALTNLTTDDQGAAGEATRFSMDAATASANQAGVNVTGAVTINDAVRFNVANSTSANPAVQTGGGQAYKGVATLERNAVLTSTVNGDLVFSKTVNGPFTLALNTGGTTQFSGLVGNLAPLTGLTTDVGGTTRIDGGGVATVNNGAAGNGAQRYGDAVVLGQNTVLSSANGTAGVGGLIRFEGTVDGGFTLGVNTSGLTVFNGLVGSTVALTGLSTDNGGGGAGEATQFNMVVGPGAAGVLVNGVVLVNDAVVFNAAGTLGQPTVLTLGDGAQTYAGAVSLAANTVLVSATALPGAGGAFAGGGAIRFTSPAGVVSTGGSDLQVRAGAGNASFAATLNVGSLDLGGAQVSFAGPVTLPGLLSVEPNGGGLGGTVTLNGGTLTTVGAQTYNAAVALGADTVLTSLGGTITFNGTLDGPFGLTVNTPGDEVFNGLVGNTTALASLTTDATGTVGGTARFVMDVAGAAAGVRVTGAVLINDGVAFNITGANLATGTPASVLSGGAQTYRGAATLAQNTVLTSTGAGDLTFGSTVDGGFGLALASAGNETFSGIVGGTTALASLTTDATGTVGGTARFVIDVAGAGAGVAGVNVAGPVLINDAVLFRVANSTAANPSVRTTGGAQTYQGAATLGADTRLVAAGLGANLAFNSTLNGSYALTLTTPGAVTLNGAVGGTTALSKLTVTGGGAATVLNAGLVRTTGSQFYGNAVLLGRDTLLTSLNGAPTGGLTFDKTVDGSYTLTLTTPGAVTLNGAVGGSAALASLTITGGGAATALNAGVVNTTGLQSYGDAVVLGQNTVLTSGNTTANGGGLLLSSTVDGSYTLTLTTPGAVTLNGAVGGSAALASLTITGGGAATALNAGVVNTTGLQSYGDAVVLGQNTVLTSGNTTANGGGLLLSSTVDGSYTLTLTTPGAVTLNGAVGGTTALSKLTVTGGGAATVLNAGLVRTTGSQFYGNAVLLGRDTLLTSLNGAPTGGLTFDKTVDGSYTLTLTTPGAVTLNGAVGGSAALASLTITGGGAATALNAGVVNTTGLQSYGNAVQLLRGTTLTSTNGGLIRFEGTVDGGFTLGVNTSGLTVFNGLVGSTVALTGLSTDNGGGGASEATQFNMVVGPGAAGVLVNGAVLVNDAVVFNAAGTLGQPTVLTLGDGAQTYAGAVSLAANTVLVSATALPGAGGAFAGGGAIRFTSPAGVVSTGGSDLQVRAGAGNASFAATLNVGSLDLGGAQVSFAGPVTLPGLLSVEPNGGGLGGTVTLNGGTLTTVGAQTYNAAVALGADTVLTSLGGTITFNGTLDGPFGLTVNTPGDEVFNGLVGNTTALASLTTDATGTVGGTARFVIDVARAGAGVAGVNVAGPVLINDAVLFRVANSTAANPSVRTTGGAQTYQGAATLGADTRLVAAGLGANLAFNSTVNGAFALTVGAGGQTIFNDSVGGVTALTSLTISGGGAATVLNAGLVRTTGSQFYGNAVQLGRDTLLTSLNPAPNGGTLAFDGAIDGAHALTLTTTGPVVLNGAVGSALPALTSLTITGGGAATALNAGTVHTTGLQTYGNAVQLLRGTTLTSLNTTANGGGLIFSSVIDGAQALTLTTPGVVTLNDAVGGSTALASLTITGGGAATALNAGSVRTTGLQLYGNAVQLLRDTLLTSLNGAADGGGLTFSSIIDGVQALTLTTPGAVTLNDAVGGGAALTSLTITGGGAATQLNAGTVRTTGLQTYGNAVQLLRDNLLTSLNGATTGGGLIFNGTVDGAQALTLTTPAAVTLNGAIGSAAALSSLTVSTGGAATLLNAGSITTTGLQFYGNAVQLQSNAALASTDASVANGGLTFNSTVNGPFALALDTPNRILFEAEVGGLPGQALASLKTSGAGATLFDDGRVTTTGFQVYGNAVRLRADGVFTTIPSALKTTGITFGKTVDGRFALNVNTQGTTLFGGQVGGTPGGNVQLVSLTTDQGGTTVFRNSGVLTSGTQTYGDAVRLDTDTALRSTGGATNGTITFAEVINGNEGGRQALAINTGGTTVFRADVGAGTALSSLSVDGGGETRVNGNTMQTQNAQTYGGTVSLGSTEVQFKSLADAVTFGGNVEGREGGDDELTALTVTSPNESAFNGDVGATFKLASLTVEAPLAVGGGYVHTLRNQYYSDAVNAARPGNADAITRMVSDRGDVRFDGIVKAGGGLTVQGNRVGAKESVTTEGDLRLEATLGGPLSPLLLLTGNSYVSNGGSVFFNAPGARQTPGQGDANASILLSSGSALISGANFTMGPLQKMFSLGSIDIETRGGTATLGDIAASNALRVNAAQIVLLSRSPGTASAGRPDDGLNFVAGRNIDFGHARITFATTSTNRTANFITTNGLITIQRVEGVSLFKDPNLASQFRVRSFGISDLDTLNVDADFFINQPVGGGSQALDTAAALSGALPDQKPVDVAADISVSASQMEELKKLGIHPRLAKATERGSAASKRALFAQLVDGQDPENYGRLQPIKGGVSRLEPSDFVVVVDRMGEREVSSILQEFADLYGKDKEKAPVIGGAFQDAFNQYTVEKQTADASGFGAYLQSQPGKYPAVETSVRGFDGLFGHIEHLGLTDKEVAKSEEHIASDLGVSGISPEDMVKVINGLRKKLPPAQKAASTKLPPAAHASNPAPGASNPAHVAPAPATVPVPAATPAPGSDALPEIKAVPEGAPAPAAPAPPATPEATPPTDQVSRTVPARHKLARAVSAPLKLDPRQAVAALP